jgi:hypothetical protein
VSELTETTIPWRDYVWRDVEHIEWQYFRIPNPSGPVTVRSMLSPYELALLRAVAQENYRGWGEIVDAGPLLGAGTNMLAKGLAANSQVANKSKRIFSFDLFLRDDPRDAIVDRFGISLQGNLKDTLRDVPDHTNSVFEEFLRVNRDYLDQLYLSPGDLLLHRWTGLPIEILFVDLAKTWELNQWVVENWFPCLRPGSIVIQQDYVHFYEYWIAITMEVLADFLHPVDYIFGASAVFVCDREIPRERLAACVRSMEVEEQLRYLDLAISKAPASAAEVLKCAKAFCLLDHDRITEAEQLIEQVRTDVEHPEGAQNFRGIAASNKQFVQQLITAVRAKRTTEGNVEPE